MSSYEIGEEVKKVNERTLSEMVIDSEFDKLLLDVISKPKSYLTKDNMALLFKEFLQLTKEK